MLKFQNHEHFITCEFVLLVCNPLNSTLFHDVPWSGPQKHGPYLHYLQHSVKIMEIYSHTFLRKISWKQRFY